MKRNIPIHYLSAGFGALVWLLGCVASGRAEAWDSGLYWSVFFPLMLVGAAIAGAWSVSEASIKAGGSSAWRQGLWMGAGHAAMALVTGLFAGMGFGLFPLTLIVFALLALPLLGAARLGALVARKLPRGGG